MSRDKRVIIIIGLTKFTNQIYQTTTCYALAVAAVAAVTMMKSIFPSKCLCRAFIRSKKGNKDFYSFVIPFLAQRLNLSGRAYHFLRMAF